MTALLTDNLPLLAGAPNGIKKLRELILDLAVRGKLVPQEPSDEPASELLKRIAEEKARLVAEGRIRKQKPLAAIEPGDQPFCLPSFWEVVRLGELIDPRRTITYGVLKPGAEDPNGVPLVKTENVQFNRILADFKSRISRELDDEFKRTRLRGGEVLLTLVGSIGRCAIAPNKLAGANLSRSVGMLVPVDLVSKEFMVYAITALINKDFIDENCAGTAQRVLNVGAVNDLAFPLPPLTEQHRIVAKVDELMALCDRLEARQTDAESAHARLVQALLDSLTQASDAVDFAANWQRLVEHFHSLFTSESSIDALKQTLLQLAVRGKLVAQDPNDEPAANLLQHYGIKSNPHFLDGWAEASLGSFGEILGGSTPSKASPEFWDGEIPWVSPKDMKRPVIHDAQDHVSAKALAQTSLKTVPPQSLLMVVRGMILAHSFPVALTAREVTINQDMKALVPPEEISTYLLMYLQAAKDVMVGLVDRSSHGTCKLISEKLWSHTVCLPPLAEQRRIVAKVDQLMALCDQLKTRLTQARQLNEQLASTLVEQAVA